MLEQWFFRITEYADRLLADLDDKEKMDWSESTTTAQRNWLGRSEGAELEFPLAAAVPQSDGDADEPVIRVYTTRPDTVFGATFMVLAPEHPLVDALTRVKNSFNAYPLDRLAQAGAIAAFEDQAYFVRRRDAVVHCREGLLLQLEDLGFSVLPSQANFVFARHPAHDAAQLAAALRARKVLVRHFAQPRIDQYLRISVGTPGQCGQLVDALVHILQAG